MRALVAVMTTAVAVLALAAVADARELALKPVAKRGHVYVFRLGSLRGKEHLVASATLQAPGLQRALAVRRVRRAVRRGHLSVRVRRHRRPRLVVRLDRHRPSAPGPLLAASEPAGVGLGWGAAKDDIGIVGYRVLRDGKPVARTAASQTAWTDRGVKPGRRHTYAVRAIDRVGRRSRLSNRARAAAAAPAAAAPAPPAAPAAPRPLPGAPSGQAMPRGDLPGWKQIFTDDFRTDVPLGQFPGKVANAWGAYTDGTKDTSGNGRYFPSKVVSIAKGVMDLHLHAEGGQPLVAAPLPKVQPAAPHGLLYGRFAVRFRADPVPGYKTAWLLWPDSGSWPAGGEIDWPEGDLNEGFCAYLHHMGASSSSDQDRFCPRAPFPQWHTAVLEWSPGVARFLLDGQPVGVSTSRVPSSPMHWVLQTETRLNGGPPPAGANGHVQIDWVAAWRRG